MRKIKIILIISVLALTSKVVCCQTVDSNYVDGWIYVKVYDSSLIELAPYDFSDPALNMLYTNYGIDTIIKPFPGLNATLDKTYRVVFSQINQINNLIADFQALPYIEYAEKAPLYRTSITPNDLQSTQWSLAKINAMNAWGITTGKNTVTVAIVDNAVSTTHEDLSPNIWNNPNDIPGNFLDDDLNGFTDDRNGWDVADGDNNPNPPAGASSSSPFVHGTHCAGIASAATDNGTGIASIGFKIKIIGVKCSKDNSTDGGNSLPYAYDGVYYCIRANADVISMSWGGSSGVFLTGESLIKAAHAAGIVLVAAAGNNNSSSAHYPSAYSEVISVGATDQTDKKATFSNFGSTVDVMAPGVSIYSTLSGGNSNYGSLSGTSMACPLVAGLAGLILSENPSLPPNDVKTLIKSGCENIDMQNPSYIGQIGSGRINAYLSLQTVSVAKTSVEENALNVFPNPTSGKLTIFIKNTPDPYKLSIFNTLGQTLIKRNSVLPYEKEEIDLSTFKSGTYFLKVESPSVLYIRKIIVNSDLNK